MIRPTLNAVNFTADVNAEDLSTLIGAVSAANIIELPVGKTLADVKMLALNVLPAAKPDGTVANISASIK